MSAVENYYDLLEVSPDATLDELRSAYRRQIRRWHPDHAGVAGEERTKALNAAKRVLFDASRRAAYDQGLVAWADGEVVEPDEVFVPQWGSVVDEKGRPRKERAPRQPRERRSAPKPPKAERPPKVKRPQPTYRFVGSNRLLAVSILVGVAAPVVAGVWHVAAFLAATGNSEDLWLLIGGVVLVVLSVFALSFGVFLVSAFLLVGGVGVTWWVWSANGVSMPLSLVLMGVAGALIGFVAWQALASKLVAKTGVKP